jgi:hypothetical protein
MKLSKKVLVALILGILCVSVAVYAVWRYYYLEISYVVGQYMVYQSAQATVDIGKDYFYLDSGDAAGGYATIEESSKTYKMNSKLYGRFYCYADLWERGGKATITVVDDVGNNEVGFRILSYSIDQHQINGYLVSNGVPYVTTTVKYINQDTPVTLEFKWVEADTYEFFVDGKSIGSISGPLGSNWAKGRMHIETSTPDFQTLVVLQFEVLEENDRS